MPAPDIGTRMEDGTVYAGLSPNTGRMLFVMPVDTPLMTHAFAVGRARSMNIVQSFGHSDWRLPTFQELHVIFLNRRKGALRDTFNEAAANYGSLGRPQEYREAPGWYRTDYWASYNTKQTQSFKDGTTAPLFDMDLASVRFIREGELPEAEPPVKSDIAATRQKRLKEMAQKVKAKFS
jgi:hypothetical protein